MYPLKKKKTIAPSIAGLFSFFGKNKRIFILFQCIIFYFLIVLVFFVIRKTRCCQAEETTSLTDYVLYYFQSRPDKESTRKSF